MGPDRLRSLRVYRRDETSLAGPPQSESSSSRVPRDVRLRTRYLTDSLRDIPRMLGCVDRNPMRSTYGCFDRAYWHYRTSDFPSEMYQEAVLPLAIVFDRAMPDNPWHGEERVRELAIAGMRFSARSGHRDGSCDDYYPFERALGAAVFSLGASARAYAILDLDDEEILEGMLQRANWLCKHNESGELANHQALAAVALLRIGRLTNERQYYEAAAARVERVLKWQSEEGWFREYGGADPGYQTLTIDALVRYRELTKSAWLDDPIRNAVRFCRWFLHPDGSYGGEFGSRGTYHFYSRGFEWLAAHYAIAAELADGRLRALGNGRAACFGDDRMYAHYTADLLDAYGDWSPVGATRARTAQLLESQYFPKASIYVRRDDERATVISLARGGVFKRTHAEERAVTDTGVLLETVDGRIATSQMHDPCRGVSVATDDDQNSGRLELSVSGHLNWCRFETATPLKLAVFRLGMIVAGRWCRDLIRRLLQARLITARKKCPVKHTRTFRFSPSEERGETVHVVDELRIEDPSLLIKRAAFGTEFESAYVAATGVYQDSNLRPWYDLADAIDELNETRYVRIERSFS